MTAPAVSFRHTTNVDDVRQLLCDIHAEVRGDFGLLERPFYSVARFNERLTNHGSVPGWEAVIGSAGNETVGFAYATPLRPKTRWWTSMREPLSEEYTTETGTRTLALNEIVVRRPGAARRSLTRSMRNCSQAVRKNGSRSW